MCIFIQKAGKNYVDKVESSIYELFISVILFMSGICPGEIGNNECGAKGIFVVVKLHRKAKNYRK